MKNIACIIARTNSKRLEKKVLKEINGLTMIEYIINKVKKSKLTDEIFLCTSDDKQDKDLIEIAKKNNIEFYAGFPDSPIERMLAVAKATNANNLIRITGDNIFTDEIYLDLMLNYHQLNHADYTRTEYLPVGVTSEVINVNALKKCYNTIPKIYSEYLMLYIFNPNIYKCLVLIPPKKHQQSNWNLSVDNENDWYRTNQIIGKNKELLNYDSIINIIQSQKIPNVEFNEKGILKFPAEILVYFETYRMEMNLRIKNSDKIYITMDEYYNYLK